MTYPIQLNIVLYNAHIYPGEDYLINMPGHIYSKYEIIFVTGLASMFIM